jgi:hypothetical protein
VYGFLFNFFLHQGGMSLALSEPDSTLKGRAARFKYGFATRKNCRLNFYLIVN